MEICGVLFTAITSKMVAGFGDSPEYAAWNFDKVWCEKIGEQKVRVTHPPQSNALREPHAGNKDEETLK